MIRMEPWRSAGLINSARICGRGFSWEGWHYQRPVWCAQISHRGSVWMPCLLDCSFDCFNYETCFHYCCHQCIINIINNWPAPHPPTSNPLWATTHLRGVVSQDPQLYLRWDEREPQWFNQFHHFREKWLTPSTRPRGYPMKEIIWKIDGDFNFTSPPAP